MAYKPMPLLVYLNIYTSGCRLWQFYPESARSVAFPFGLWLNTDFGLSFSFSPEVIFDPLL